MSKRTLMMVVALVAALALAATGTLAYLTDTDSDVNVMTLGNVDIEQHEMKRKDGIKYNATLQEGDLEPFEDGIKLFPAYPVNGEATDYTAAPVGDMLKWGPYVHTGTAGNGLWNESKLVGAVDKMVFVENTGESPAYFRTLIAFERPDGVDIGEPSQGAHIMINENGSETMYNPPKSRFAATIVVDGVQYEVFEYIYQDALLPGEWSHPSLLQVVMTHNATNETIKLLGDTYDILALSQAVQVENLEQLGAEKALDAAFGETNEENLKKWFGEVEVPTLVTDEATLIEALEKGGLVQLANDITVDETMRIAAGADVTIDLNGCTLTGNVHKDNGAVLRNEGTLTIKNGTVSSTAGNGGSALLNKGTVTAEGVTFNGASNEGSGWPAYTINNNAGVATFTNCDITSVHGGLCSYNANALATLNDCTLSMSGIPGFTSHGFYTYEGGKIIVNGGTYANNATDQNATGASVLNGTVEVNDGTFTGRIDAYYGTPVIKGGTYSVKPGASYVAPGYTAQDNGNGTYTVVAE